MRAACYLLWALGGGGGPALAQNSQVAWPDLVGKFGFVSHSKGTGGPQAEACRQFAKTDVDQIKAQGFACLGTGGGGGRAWASCHRAQGDQFSELLVFASARSCQDAWAQRPTDK